MRVPAKLAFSSKYIGYEICGALGLLDQCFCEEPGMAEVCDRGRDSFPEIDRSLGARWERAKGVGGYNCWSSKALHRFITVGRISTEGTPGDLKCYTRTNLSHSSLPRPLRNRCEDRCDLRKPRSEPAHSSVRVCPPLKGNLGTDASDYHVFLGDRVVSRSSKVER